MFFHGPAKEDKGQRTFAAISTDGINFVASDEILGPSYMRAFRRDGWTYGVFGAAHQEIRRSADGLK